MHELQHLPPPFQNERLMVERLDLLEEYREAATIRLAEYQQKLGVMESGGEHVGYKRWEISPDLGGAL